MPTPDIHKIKKLGYSSDLSEGILRALQGYENVDLNKYISMCKESIEYLTPSAEQNVEIPDEKIDMGVAEEMKTKKTTDKKTSEEDKTSEELEEKVLETIKKIEGENGAAWDLITEKCGESGIDKNTVEEILTSLMEKGLIYEPVLGTIKTT